MKTQRFIQPVFVAIAFTVAITRCQADGNEPSVADLFARMNNQWNQLTALSYTVTRASEAGTQVVEEKWDFKLKTPDRIKIEYYTPTRRVLIIDGATMWEYIPAAKKAMRTDLGAKNADERARLIAGVLGHVSVDGLRIGDYADMLTRVTTVTQDVHGVVTVTGDGPKFVLQMDGKQNALLHTEFYTAEGELRIQTDASGFVQVTPELWFPQNITVLCRSKEALIRSEINLSNIRANDEPSDDIFQFTAPKGVDVMKQ